MDEHTVKATTQCQLQQEEEGREAEGARSKFTKTPAENPGQREGCEGSSAIDGVDQSLY